MQRYNPPSTSAQMYCMGCQRQIRKVQQVMDENYLNNIHFQVEKNKLRSQLARAESELEMEKCKVETMEVAMKKASTPEETDEKIKELMEINRKLTEELQKATMPPEVYPLEEWYQSINGKWSERYDTVKQYAFDKKAEVEEYQKIEDELNEEIYNYRREISYLKRLLMSKDKDISDRKATEKKKAEPVPKLEKENIEESEEDGFDEKLAKVAKCIKGGRSVSTEV